MPNLFGNKGDWSEIYTFLRLLDIGKLYAADSNLNRLENDFYNIINIVRNENMGDLEFCINTKNNTIDVKNYKDNQVLITLSRNEFKKIANELLRVIKTKKVSSFAVETVEEFLNNIYVTKLKAKSTDKADIRMKIHDKNTGIDSVQGFSIKSRLGSPSTLINAGKTTNFVYEITGKINENIANEFNNEFKKFRDKFDYLSSNKCELYFIKVDNAVFSNNLMLLDSSLPYICSFMLKEYYKAGTSNIESALEFISRVNPLEFDMSNGQPFYNYKFKKLLTECALGMLPSKSWDGRADATGGYIVVRDDGEVLCYHLYNRNEFEDYLIKNTKFETASTTRHEFGNIYKENGKYYIKLNLQVRFLK